MKTRTHRTTVAIAAIALVVAVAACGETDTGESPDPTAAPGAAQVTVVVTEFDFDPVEIQIPAGTAVEVTLDNQGVVEHDLHIDELGIRIHAAAGQTATETITVPAGTYRVICSVPGHEDAGMEGTLTAG